jgi:hypothetical protein
MPHVVLHSPLSPAQIAVRFEPMAWTEGETAVSLIDLFQSTRDGKLLIEAYVNEPAISQRLGPPFGSAKILLCRCFANCWLLVWATAPLVLVGLGRLAPAAGVDFVGALLYKSIQSGRRSRQGCISCPGVQRLFPKR